MNCLLISPRVPRHSFLNYQEICKALGVRYPAMPLGLLTVAAILPQDWCFRLLDLNTQEMDEAELDWAELVLATGMIPQQSALLSIINLAHQHGKLIGVGGPGPTSQPEVYAAADFRVLNEGEATIPLFLQDFLGGATGGLYRSAEKPDLRRSPTPRYDLIDIADYEHADVQFSRGCPGNCEFCDAPVVYGRRLRCKSPDQVFHELELLERLGYRGHVHFVDDNFIGAHSEVTEFLRQLAEWSRKHKYPFFYGTNATLGLADEPELLQLMEDCDFRMVFVGIESPQTVLLSGMHKEVNVRHPIVSSVRRLYDHGLIVTTGFILGFDEEDDSAREAIIRCVEATGVGMVIVGLLTALPITPLGLRLAAEGRYCAADEPAGRLVDETIDGLNFRSVRPVADIFRDSAALYAALYEPASYFNRLLDVAQSVRAKPKHRPNFAESRRLLRAFVFVLVKLGFRPRTAPYFWRAFFRLLLRGPRAVETGFILMALYLHLGPQADYTIRAMQQKIEQLENATAGQPA